MKIRAWEILELAGTRMFAIAGAAAAVCAAATAVAATPILGGYGVLLAAVVGLIAAYTVATLPHRELERSSLFQAAEAPTLAASASVYLTSTGSRSKTILLLESPEPSLAELF